MRQVDADQLADAHPGVEQQPDNDGVAPIRELLAGADLEQPGQLVGGQDGHWRLGDRRRSELGHRVLGQLVLVDQPPAEPLQSASISRLTGSKKTVSRPYEGGGSGGRLGAGGTPSSLSFFFRLGCTRSGSPSILGNCGG